MAKRVLDSSVVFPKSVEYFECHSGQAGDS